MRSPAHRQAPRNDRPGVWSGRCNSVTVIYGLGFMWPKLYGIVAENFRYGINY